MPANQAETLVRAAMVSARFPLVLPPYSIQVDPSAAPDSTTGSVPAAQSSEQSSYWNFVDGAYSDNSGAATALSLYRALSATAQSRHVALRLILLTSSDPQLAASQDQRHDLRRSHGAGERGAQRQGGLGQRSGRAGLRRRPRRRRRSKRKHDSAGASTAAPRRHQTRAKIGPTGLTRRCKSSVSRTRPTVWRWGGKSRRQRSAWCLGCWGARISSVRPTAMKRWSTATRLRNQTDNSF